MSGKLDQRVEKGFAEVNGTSLYYERTGEGNTLILVHGWTLDTRMWDDQFDVFGKHYQVVRYDLRGYGRSALPTDEEYSHSDDLRALMNHLELTNAYVVGLSMGGAIAIMFALDYPESVAALVAVDSTLGGYEWSPDYGASLDAIFVAGRKVGHDAALERLLDFEILEPAMEDPKVAVRLKEIISDYSGYHWISDTVNWGTTTAPPAIERLDQIRIPTLAIVGGRDSPEFHTIASILEQQIPNIQKIIIPGVGHVPNMEKPGEFNEIVLGFLSNIEKESQ